MQKASAPVKSEKEYFSRSLKPAHVHQFEALRVGFLSLAQIDYSQCDQPFVDFYEIHVIFVRNDLQ